MNGARILEPAARVRVGVDAVTVDGARVRLLRPTSRSHFYFAVNKPKGYVCSSETPNAGSPLHAQRRVIDLLQGWVKERDEMERCKNPDRPAIIRLFTVGRLDVKTTGLIFVTNDGSWASRVTHPSSGLLREYVATMSRPPNREEIKRIRAGEEVDGAHVRPVSVQRIQGAPNALRIWIGEGRNREVRSLASAAGLEVRNLRRAAFGPYRLPSNVAPGAWVRISPREAREILASATDEKKKTATATKDRRTAAGDAGRAARDPDPRSEATGEARRPERSEGGDLDDGAASSAGWVSNGTGAFSSAESVDTDASSDESEAGPRGHLDDCERPLHRQDPKDPETWWLALMAREAPSTYVHEAPASDAPAGAPLEGPLESRPARADRPTDEAPTKGADAPPPRPDEPPHTAPLDANHPTQP